ncbi:hypothetical protein [Phaffia rhodozyma]|uniref:Uncharacterized protein n=1 Tax=Phaffia rhodozyma TaxID=264483 RepID=A0A0F7SVK8_PHARH|nr:hypothetical protein [Phaffia rhodozyma]
MDTIINLISSQLPPAVRPYVSAFTSSDGNDDNEIVGFIKRHLPLVMSLVALYFGAMSMLRTARMAWRTFYFTAKWGLLVAAVSAVYSAFTNGPEVAVAQTQNAFSQVVRAVGPIGSLAAWYFGATSGNLENLKQVAGWALGGQDSTKKTSSPLAGLFSSSSSGRGSKPADASGQETVRSFVDGVAGVVPEGVIEGFMKNSWKGAFDAFVGDAGSNNGKAKAKPKTAKKQTKTGKGWTG